MPVQPVNGVTQSVGGASGVGPTLKFGSEGPAVERLQRLLNQSGVAGKVVVDGDYGLQTMGAVKAFQKSRGLVVDGWVGPQTWGALGKVSTSGKADPTPTLKIGANGAKVTELQKLLCAKGHKVVVDGDFGPQTQGAVKAFQKSQGLAQDGVVGDKTWKALRSTGTQPPKDPPKVDDTPTLKIGAKGAKVTELQKLLCAKGHKVVVDGDFGPQTQGAVNAFKKSQGLPADGVVGDKAWEALRSKGTQPPKDPPTVDKTPTLKIGAKGEAVESAQKRLNAHGYYCAVDGDFGPQTQGSVKDFQRARKLPVTGVIDDATWKALRATPPAPPPGQVTKPPVVWKPSPNYSTRTHDIDAIILHHTASNNTEGDLATLRRQNGSKSVSAHYLVGKDGTIYQLVGDEKRAWHAGIGSSLHGEDNVNDRSIGIEITNDGLGKTPYTEAQYKALEKLVPWLAKTYKVPLDHVLGHKQVAPGYKIDPSANFDFNRIRRAVDRVV